MSTEPPPSGGPTRPSGPPRSRASRSTDKPAETAEQTSEQTVSEETAAQPAVAPIDTSTAGQPATDTVTGPATTAKPTAPSSEPVIEAAGVEEPTPGHTAGQPPQPTPIPTMVVTPGSVSDAEPTPITGAVASVSGQRAGAVSPDDIVYTPYALSVGDGFKFGCGVVLAIGVAVMLLALIVALLVLIASLAGVSLPLGPTLI